MRIIILLIISISLKAQPYTIIKSKTGDTLFLKNFANGNLMKLNYRDFKTINGASIMGVGNIDVAGDTSVDLKASLNTFETKLNTITRLTADTNLNTTWDGQGRVFKYFGYKIKGSGNFVNWVIDAPLTADIFDTSINLIGCTSYNNIFSCAWYGAKASNPDNWWNIQKAINYCVGNIPGLFLPAGTYNYSKPLEIFSIYQNQYVSATLHFYGESVFNGSTNGSTLAYGHYADWALNIQVGKGVEVDHLNITGKWKSPETVDSIYYKTLYSDYNDISGFGCNEWYYGISIDVHNQIGNVNRKGSTGIKIHDVTITGFTKLIGISQRQTQNGEMLFFDNIALGDARVGIATGQAQEKGNWIRNIKAWGRIHTVFQIGRSGEQASAGDWHIEGGNIDGAVRVFDINASSWYSTTINGLYAENIGTIGSMFAAVPLSVINSTFHFRQGLGQRIILTCSGSNVVFRDCIARHYGTALDVWVSGAAVFQNCTVNGGGGGILVYK